MWLHGKAFNVLRWKMLLQSSDILTIKGITSAANYVNKTNSFIVVLGWGNTGVIVGVLDPSGATVLIVGATTAAVQNATEQVTGTIFAPVPAGAPTLVDLADNHSYSENNTISGAWPLFQSNSKLLVDWNSGQAPLIV